MTIHCDVQGCPGGGEPDAIRGGGIRVHLDVPPFCARRLKPHARSTRDAPSTVALVLLVVLMLVALAFGCQVLLR